MRRLIGLIALLALILGAAWLARIDFDLKRIADFDALFGPPGEGEAAKALSEEATPALATGPNAAPGSAPAGTGVAAAPQDAAAENPPGQASEATAAVKPRSPDSGVVEPSAPAAQPPVPEPEEMAAVEPAVPEAETAMTSAPPAAGTATATAMPAVAGAVEPPAATVPRFDIVRVEPTGETVIAGVAEPEAVVEVLDGPEAVASAEANDRGEWALVLDAPLPPGTHDLGIRMTSPGRPEVTLSDQRVAVSVPDSADEEPLVVLNEPNAPSRVIQLPADAGPAAGPEVAALSEPQADAMARPPLSAETGTAATPQPEAMTETAPASGGAEMTTSPMQTPASQPGFASAPAPMSAPDSVKTAPSQAFPMAAASGRMAPDQPEASSAMTAGVPAASPEPPPTIGEAASESPSAPAPGAMTATSPAGQATHIRPETAGSAAESAALAEAPPPELGVAAVEAETNGALYIAGTATGPEPVRVYVDDEFLGEATPTESGTWLLETERELPPDEYTIRADQVDAGSGKVVARAEVPFEREIAVAALKPIGETVVAGPAEASGSVAGPMKVIIKRGDNLWRISRELYGHGIRYSTIYQANREQIRNPHWIYPGQVFVLPAGDTRWQD